MNVIIYNNLEGCEYYEPFAGGAGAALYLLKEGIVKRLHLNDVDRSVYAFWHSVLKNTDLLVEKIAKTKVLVRGMMVATIVALPKVILFFMFLLNKYI